MGRMGPYFVSHACHLRVIWESFSYTSVVNCCVWEGSFRVTCVSFGAPRVGFKLLDKALLLRALHPGVPDISCQLRQWSNVVGVLKIGVSKKMGPERMKTMPSIPVKLGFAYST